MIMNLLIPLCTGLLLILCTSANAETYKHTDEEGITSYSDTQIEGSKEIITPLGNSIQLPKYTTKKKIVKEKPIFYTHLSILSPKHDATIRNNAGNIPVKLLLTPDLHVKKIIASLSILIIS